MLLAIGRLGVAARHCPSTAPWRTCFRADSQLLQDYRLLKRAFGGNEIVLAVYQDADLFAADGVGIRRLAASASSWKRSLACGPC